MVGEVLNEGEEPPTIIEIFDQQCPYYMAMGMSLQEFWEGDPRLAIYYRKAFEYRQELINDWEWRMGVYNLTAFGVVLGNAFRKKGTKPQEYMKKPLPLHEQTEAEKKAEDKQQNDKIASLLEKHMMQHKKAKAKEQENARSY